MSRNNLKGLGLIIVGVALICVAMLIGTQFLHLKVWQVPINGVCNVVGGITWSSDAWRWYHHVADCANCVFVISGIASIYFGIKKIFTR